MLAAQPRPTGFGIDVMDPKHYGEAAMVAYPPEPEPEELTPAGGTQ